MKGKVKTRIARTAGDDAALEIYLELSKITRDNVLLFRQETHVSDTSAILRGVKIYLFYSDFIGTNDEWSNNYFDKQVQTGEDLGERMYNAFDFVLKTHRHACIIGSDCPTLSVEIMNQAFHQLSTFDCVLGPSTDGGYYLLGIKKPENEAKSDDLHFSQIIRHLFDNMVWSTEQVLSNTLQRIKENSQTVFLLPELTDIDEEADWLYFQKNKQGK